MLHWSSLLQNLIFFFVCITVMDICRLQLANMPHGVPWEMAAAVGNNSCYLRLYAGSCTVESTEYMHKNKQTKRSLYGIPAVSLHNSRAQEPLNVLIITLAWNSNVSCMTFLLFTIKHLPHITYILCYWNTVDACSVRQRFTDHKSFKNIEKIKINSGVFLCNIPSVTMWCTFHPKKAKQSKTLNAHLTDLLSILNGAWYTSALSLNSHNKNSNNYL